MTTAEDVERVMKDAVRPDETCDAATQFPLGSWLVCEAKGPHDIHWGKAPDGTGFRTHRWTDKETE